MSTNGLGPGGLGFPEWGCRCSSSCQRRHREDQVHETKGRNRIVVFQSLDHLYFFKILFVDYTTIDMTWYDRIDRMYEYSMCTVLFFFWNESQTTTDLGMVQKTRRWKNGSSTTNPHWWWPDFWPINCLHVSVFVPDKNRPFWRVKPSTSIRAFLHLLVSIAKAGHVARGVDMCCAANPS